MVKRLWVLLALIVVAGAQMPAQQFPPGFVDPAPVLAAASKAINEQSLRCITFSGIGYSGPVGQTFENAVNIDWPRSEIANYTRTINWETGTSKETFDRKPGNNPASWKYGLGWIGGTPTQANSRQTHIVNGKYAWHIDGNGVPVAVPPELAEIYQLDLWLNPHGFLKAARMPGANPRAVLTYKARTVKPDILALWPPTELAEGYNYEAIQENFVITDNSRILRVYYVQPLQHVAGMLMAYLPAERIAFEADLFDTHEAPKPAQIPSMRSFYNQVQRMKLDVGTVAPVHGKPVPWSTYMTALGPAAKTN